MEKVYMISNTEGRTGGEWPDEFPTQEHAAHAVMCAMGWDAVVLSEPFAATDDGLAGTAWCCYPDTGARDADEGDGSHAPRIFLRA